MLGGPRESGVRAGSLPLGEVENSGSGGGVDDDRVEMTSHLADGPTVGKSEFIVGDATECPRRW